MTDNKINQKLQDLIQEFILENNKHNLSAIKDPQEIQTKHIDDSLKILDYIDLQNKKILDLGCGGGFPCIPLAIQLPKSNFWGLDSVEKKLDSIREICNKLDIRNLETVNARAEEIAHKESFREKFDVVLARAFAPWPVLLELALPFVKKGGILVAYQGPSIQASLDEYKEYERHFGGKIKEVIATQVQDHQRIFIVIEKESTTELKFPRKYNQIKNKKL